jgi:SpoVK/Ycf46/Vps4 family AAA+-type ATPase
VLPDDIDGNYFRLQGSPYDKAIEELQSMVGLSEIKRSIVTLANRVKFYAERRQLGLQSSDMGVYHTILTGNPGTGKTTVARLLGRIYHSLGLLSKGDVICVDRKKIIGRYIGETEENMKMILREAQGNVLFVDEAYTLYTTGDERDFGRHAVECLLDVLSRKNPDMLIIFAGYEKEMDALMSMNPGLVGRFPYKFRFPNYTPDELMQIALKMLDADHYELTPEAHSSLLQTIRETVAARSETFANARWVEQFVMGGIIPALADRVSGTPHVLDRSVYQRIEAADVQTASARFGAKSIELRQRPAIGFCA